MIFLEAGEWWRSNLWFGLVFFVCAFGVAGLGYWVLRGDSRNHEIDPSWQAAQAGVEPSTTSAPEVEAH